MCILENMLTDLKYGLVGFTIVSDEITRENDLNIEKLLQTSQDTRIDVDYTANNGITHRFKGKLPHVVYGFILSEFQNKRREFESTYLDTRKIVFQNGTIQVHHIHFSLGNFAIRIGDDIIREPPYKEATLEYIVKTE